MDLDHWLQSAIQDAERRGLPELKPLIETLGRAARAVRDLERTIRPDQPRASGAP
jgi:hypothetical protein